MVKTEYISSSESDNPFLHKRDASPRDTNPGYAVRSLYSDNSSSGPARCESLSTVGTVYSGSEPKATGKVPDFCRITEGTAYSGSEPKATNKAPSFGLPPVETALPLSLPIGKNYIEYQGKPITPLDPPPDSPPPLGRIQEAVSPAVLTLDTLRWVNLTHLYYGQRICACLILIISGIALLNVFDIFQEGNTRRQRQYAVLKTFAGLLCLLMQWRSRTLLILAPVVFGIAYLWELLMPLVFSLFEVNASLSWCRSVGLLHCDDHSAITQSMILYAFWELAYIALGFAAMMKFRQLVALQKEVDTEIFRRGLPFVREYDEESPQGRSSFCQSPGMIALPGRNVAKIDAAVLVTEGRE